MCIACHDCERVWRETVARIGVLAEGKGENKRNSWRDVAVRIRLSSPHEWVSSGTPLSSGTALGKGTRQDKNGLANCGQWLLMDTKGLRNLYQDP